MYDIPYESTYGQLYFGPKKIQIQNSYFDHFRTKITYSDLNTLITLLKDTSLRCLGIDFFLFESEVMSNLMSKGPFQSGLLMSKVFFLQNVILKRPFNLHLRFSRA